MSGRNVLARGTVLVDPRKAVEKLRAFQLAQPGLYVLEVVRDATLLGANSIALYHDSDDLELTWSGAAPPDVRPRAVPRLRPWAPSRAGRTR